MNDKMKYCIIVAGGKGLRMGEKTPKQFLLLQGKPVIHWSIDVFHNFDPSMPLFLVLPETYINYWQELIKQYPVPEMVIIVPGGKTRYHSVKNAIAKLPDTGIVAIHDAARPFPGYDLISRCFLQAKEKGNAIPYIPVTDTLRKLEGNNNFSVNREDYVGLQTPQIIDIKLLKKAFKQAWKDSFTDESNMLESIGETINLVKGESSNIKITNKTDLKLAGILNNNDPYSESLKP